jgi:hypothetical protein
VRDDQPWQAIAEAQAGVIARRQLLELGLSARQSRRGLDSGRWRQAHPGVYLTFTGPTSDEARVWAAVLYAGAGAAVGGRTALWLAKASTELPDPLEILVPHRRQVETIAGVRIRRCRSLADQLHPAAAPARVRLEVAVLDVAASFEREEQVVDIALRVIQRRLTTAARILQQLNSQARHRWRRLLTEVLAEAADGVASALERRYARDVERAHGLPRGNRNRPEGVPGRRRYHDVRYQGFGTVVELDGWESHPVQEAFRDARRDNAATVRGDRVLRYGWRDTVGRPCDTAIQVGAVLREQGWPAQLLPCGPSCSVARIG